MQMFFGASGASAFTGYVKSGILVNKKFCELLISTLLMSMSSQLRVFFGGVIVKLPAQSIAHSDSPAL